MCIRDRGGATWRWSHDALHQVRETTAPDGGVTQTEQDMLGRLLSVKAVSYTHLDVYKRQSQK